MIARQDSCMRIAITISRISIDIMTNIDQVVQLLAFASDEIVIEEDVVSRSQSIARTWLTTHTPLFFVQIRTCIHPSIHYRVAYSNRAVLRQQRCTHSANQQKRLYIHITL